MERVDVAVVGAGVIGSATARALGARGVSAVLLEQFDLGHARGSSHGATRIFRLAYPDSGYVRMAVAARARWAAVQADAGEELLVRTGGLDAGPGAAACAAALAECGVEHAWLEAGELRDRYPGLAVEPGERMLFQPDAGVSLAGRAVGALQRLARRDGVPVRAGAHVRGIESRGDHVVLRTAGGDILARVAVLAAGPWTAGLLPGVVTAAPQLTATLQQVRYFAPRDPAAGRWPTLIEWAPDGASWYVVPMAGDAPGVKVASHLPGRAVDPRDGPFAALDPALEQAAAQYVRRRLPGLEPAGRAAETCLYTMTADEDFVVDREGPVVVGGGCSGHAFKFGPLLGEMLADLALGAETSVPRERFALSRAALAGAPVVDES
ncbi:MAG TPA: FAD-dependent oxidoreductase [Streptosporangiaceae bacterium]|nr:FAD-dependent oxidoreductase [Streptosporangiaceae bacterium]